MVISDFIIICKSQTTFTRYVCSNMDVEINYRRNFGKSWKRMKRIKGIWYCISPCDIDGERLYDDEFFDIGHQYQHSYKVVVMNKWIEDLLKVIKFYLEASPVGEVYILIWLDGEAKFPCVSFDFDDFCEALISNKLVFGRMYHVWTGMEKY